MHRKREPIDKDEETGAEPTGESPTPSSGEAAAMPGEVSHDAGGEDSADGAEGVELEASTDDALSGEFIADAPEPVSDEILATDPPYFPPLAPDTPTVLSESGVAPDAFVNNALSSGPADAEPFMDMTSGEWLASAGVPAAFAQSVEVEAPPQPTASDLAKHPGHAGRNDGAPSAESQNRRAAAVEQLFVTPGGPDATWSMRPQSDSSPYEPLGMTRPLVLVEDADRDGSIRAELDAFAQRMTDVGKQTADAAVRYAEWFRWTEERRLNPELR